MTLTRRIGYGVTLSCDPLNGSPPNPQVLGALVDVIDGADAKADVVDTAILGDKYKTKAVAQVDPGEVTFNIAYDPADTSTTTVLTGLLKNGNIAYWQITYPAMPSGGGATESFVGPVSGFKRTIDKSKMIIASVTVAVSGDPGFTGDH